MRVLEEADSESTAPNFAIEEFATYLAQFSEAWATRSGDLEDRERWLETWVRKTRLENRIQNGSSEDHIRFRTASNEYAVNDDFEITGPGLVDADAE
jgi:hypothetical protein